jgi:predicted dehydrogenase
MRSQKKDTTRRDFLKGGAAIAGTAMAGRYAYAVDTAPKKIRIGVVGGRFGASFYWHEHPDCEVVAVSDLRPKRKQHLMDVYKCEKSYDSLELLVKDPDIDAVAVFTDAPLHVQHTEECMKHGKHVISAVPACVGSVEEAERLRDVVEKYGLTYMMAETGYYQHFTISARKWYEAGEFGEIYYCESEYQHDGLDHLFFEKGKRTWRHGFAPMHYPTHCTVHLVGITGERLTEVVCHGWGDGDPVLQDNQYNNPFWNGSAMFRTDRGHGFRVNVWWKGAHRGCERAEWIGTDMSFYAQHPNGVGPVLVRPRNRTEKDDGGFERTKPDFEKYEQVAWDLTDMLPEPLRHRSGHEGSHTFITHEFIDALAHDRKPTVDLYEALAYTVPGIVAHESALRHGEHMKIPQFEPPKKA